MKAKRKIALTDYGIEECKTRRGYAGGLVIEIPGEGATQKADRFAEKLKEVLEDDRVRVQRPVKKINIKIIGIDETTNKEEITDALSRVGDCKKEEIRVSDIRRTMRGIGIAWVQCGVETAIKILEKERISIGWTTVRSEVAAPRPMRCFKCMEMGHSRYNCKSSIDRSSNCYNCGEIGHNAVNCIKKPSCMICKYYDKPHGHRIGGNRCAPITAEDRRRHRDRRPVNNTVELE